MHIEVQVALNFVISYLYNKLPRRRVNIFGEELEKALKDKFRGHWYPEKPFKGSAFRCLKTGEPLDPVLQRASRESGVPVRDVLENLPPELAVWVDPGEVSYRIGEKGVVKVLFSEEQQEDRCADREVTRTFNPEAQCFRPIEAVSGGLGALSLSPRASASLGGSPAPVPPPAAPPLALTFRGSPGPAPPPAFLPRAAQPLTFTTATFAQTKFGSTKLKTTSKRANRMSPTEFSNYIKQRALQQQQGGGRAMSPSEAPCYYPGAPFAPQYGGGVRFGEGRPDQQQQPTPSGGGARFGPTAAPQQAPPPSDRAWAPASDLAPRYQPLLLAN